MKKSVTVFSRVMVSALTGLFLVSCAQVKDIVKEPEVSVKNMKVTGVSLTDMQLDFILGVKNPNSLGISLNGLSYKLDIEDKSLLRGKSRQKLNVAANSSSRLTLPLSLNYQDMAGGLEALYKRDKIRYALSGDVDFGLFSLPYKKRGVIELPSLPDVSIGKVGVKRMTLSGMDIVVAMQVTNRNNFPLKLDGIDYGLKIADVTVASGKSLGALAVEPGKSGGMNVGLSLGYGDLGNVIKALGSSSTIPVALDGRLQLPGGGSVPLSWQGDVAIAR